MELVFYYVNLSSTGFIEKQGFNFSPNHYFEINYIKQEKKYELCKKDRKKKIHENFFDESGCISNITAIVGENGAGKTTLLESFLYSDFFTEKEEKMKENKFEQKKQIAVYKDKNQLVCYHNIENFEAKFNIKCVQIEGVNTISKISLTNSIYAKNVLSTCNSTDPIILNTNSLSTIKNSFYNTKFKLGKSIYGGFHEIPVMLSEYRSVTEFQQLLDVLYLNYIKNKSDKSIFDNILHRDLNISFQNIDVYLVKWLKEKYDISVEDKKNDEIIKEEVQLAKYYFIWKKMISNIEPKVFEEDIFLVAYSNLLYELIADRHIENVEECKDKEELIECIEKVIYDMGERRKTNSQYFSDALKEIKEYEACIIHRYSLQKSKLVDAPYNLVMHNNVSYNVFLEMIKISMLEKEHSFILKYINIGGLKFSSGERALLNFFSWIYFTTCFQKKEIKNNVMLLIDEIDLYCHPSWQQKLINYLIQEIRVYFKGKEVQIVFTTHSPIVLSDIPKTNIIYLRQKNGKLSIDDNTNHNETFGANIYKLFDDAFFLEKQGQIGEFAKNKIQNIINQLLSLKNENCESNPKLKQLESEISLIGEPILHDKLSSMLFKYKCPGKDIKDRKIKLLQEKIKQLKGED